MCWRWRQTVGVAAGMVVLLAGAFWAEYWTGSGDSSPALQSVFSTHPASLNLTHGKKRTKEYGYKYTVLEDSILNH